MNDYLKYVKLDLDLPNPIRAKEFDAGIDLYSTSTLTISPGERELVGTGIAVELPVNTVGFINPRSGLALNKGLSIVNSPGTIDAGYRGEIKVCLINLDPREPISITRGDRIAQLVILPILLLEPLKVENLSDSERGATGYGSSGIK